MDVRNTIAHGKEQRRTVAYTECFFTVIADLISNANIRVKINGSTCYLKRLTAPQKITTGQIRGAVIRGGRGGPANQSSVGGTDLNILTVSSVKNHSKEKFLGQLMAKLSTPLQV